MSTRSSGSAHNINAPSAYGAHQPHAGAHVPMGVPASAHAGAPGYAVPAAAAPPAAARPPVDPLTQNPDQLFASTDSDRSGRLDLQELQRALYQGGFPNFSKRAAKLMIGMFDRESKKHIDRANFMALWKYLCDWKKSFDGFDKDRSGSIDQMELANAIQGFGYRFSEPFYKKVNRWFDEDGNGTISFDEFITLFCELQTLTEIFKKHDKAMNGIGEFQYEDFLTAVFSLNH